MRAADIAMYRAKSRGGGQHCLFDGELAAEHQQKIETEKALTEAVQRDEFTFAFQPQMSLVTGEIAGAEALLRWNHPRDGLRLPGTFIPIAERTGLISEIGEWVVGEIATTLGNWRRDGFDGRLAFNVSPRQVERPDFFVRLRQSFADADVPLDMIELEFTESAAMEISASVIEEIAALRDDGAHIAIDDFGTGYSNLARLRAMPLDRVKLDPSLIADIETSEGAVIIQAVIQLIKGVECEVVAEAVETVAQADMLRAMGCDPSRAMFLPSRCSRTISSPGPEVAAAATPSRSLKSVPFARSVRRFATARGCHRPMRAHRPCAWWRWEGRSRPPGRVDQETPVRRAAAGRSSGLLPVSSSIAATTTSYSLPGGVRNASPEMRAVTSRPALRVRRSLRPA